MHFNMYIVIGNFTKIDEKKTKMRLVITGIIFCIISSAAEHNPCIFTSTTESEKILKGFNVSSDGLIFFFLNGDQDDCSFNLDVIYGELFANIVKPNANRTEVFKELNFICNKRTKLHFLSKNMNTLEDRRVSVGLVFGNCDAYLQDLQYFFNYGHIWSITQSSDSVMHVLSQSFKCPFAKHVRLISAEISCNNSAHVKRFFWEACEDIFEKVAAVHLSSCTGNHYKLKQETLVNSFPKLQSLLLRSVDLVSQVTFPWTQSYIDVRDNDLIKFLSNETETNSTTFAMRRHFEIVDTNTNFNSVLHLNGNIAIIVINKAFLTQNESDIFKNVSGLSIIDLSYNNITEIDEFLLEEQRGLLEVHLQYNYLVDLSPKAFLHQLKLEFLDLSNNYLGRIDRNLLKNQRFLRELHLEYNQLQFLPEDFLKEQLSSLEYLYLHSNPVRTIPEMPFYGTRIKVIDIHSSSITGESIVDFVTRLNIYDLMYAGAEREASEPKNKFKKVIYKKPELILSFCKIRRVAVDLTIQNTTSLNFSQLFKLFKISADGNPLTCKCEMYNLVKLIQLKETEGIDINWKCMYPDELNGKLLSAITAHDLYCKFDVQNCPAQSSCNERVDLSSFIVDCRNTNTSILPKLLPKTEVLELWFRNTSLAILDKRDYLGNVSVLDLSYNKLATISPLVVLQLKTIHTLKLEHNDLTSLPIQIKYINISRLSLGGNAFVCDCHTRWMLDWLHDRLSPVIDWNVIKCIDNNKNSRQFINVPKSAFVCNTVSIPSIASHVIFPSILIGSILFVIVVLSLLIYVQRFSVKVLLYIIFGFRGCLDLNENPQDYTYDCVIIYKESDKEFVKNIITNLKRTGYVVADIYEDAVIGLTHVEGIRRLIINSKRVIFSFTSEDLQNDLMKTWWNIAFDRAVNTSIGTIILISDGTLKSACNDENIKVYLKNGRYISRGSRLLLKNIEYLLPTPGRRERVDHIENDLELEPENDYNGIHLQENNRNCDAGVTVRDVTADIYVVYPDELHRLVRYELIPFLREHNLNACALQDDIGYGDVITDIIHAKLDRVNHVIFLLSNETLQTLQTDNYEGNQLGYILPNILSKAFVSSHNYLLLFTSGFIDVDDLPEDLKKYMNMYITANVNDERFKTRLLNSLLFGGSADREVADDIEDNLEFDDDADAENLI